MRMKALPLALLLAATSARAEQVTVFAAASLKTALDGIAADWGAATGHEVVASYAGTPQLARQIEEGAPADLFLSASSDWMDDLEGKGVIVAESRRDLLGNTLVLVGHGEAAPLEIGPGTDWAALLGDGRLAMAMVDSVPAGIYGREALTSMGAWASVEPLVAQAENVRAALALVAQGEAPYGIVYGSDAIADDDVTVVGTFPADSHSPITYPAALVAGRDNPAAAAFLDHLSSPEARTAFEAQGFLVLD
ncbi:molybdate ABC transporter substrate-binding protein [Rubellimicrobium aerolatum]|uniref:Molybdate ABC transporter substrate-binding protein n=1 Tax=Rubellimicrobium aerolatum TaxID=490979 RepID=A0ABW0SFE5_9RHOB|nr:molybdate ABC transporter substrate-binding protein [Rubellimicrobium aerolatum]MBP1807178.1 molybdate transport system substrate-binding protein [Rubellimicrobium aerolatum]